MEIPQTPLPWNIKSFRRIEIKLVIFKGLFFIYFSHFDARTMDFMANIKSLMVSLKVCVGYITLDCLDNLRIILTNLVPILDGVQALYCFNSAFPMVKELLFRENEKLAKLKWIEINFFTITAFFFQIKNKFWFISEMEHQGNVAFIMNWLAQPDTDGPRLFQFRSENDFSNKISVAIREVNSIQPILFRIKILFLAIPCCNNSAHICRGLETLHMGRKATR